MFSNPTKSNKSMGILAHPTSLPGGSYCGTFGNGLKKWIELLAKYKIHNWQFLPLNPVDSFGSPYNSPSSFALNPWFLDVDELFENGFIVESESTKEIKKNGQKLEYFDFQIADKLIKIVSKLVINEWNSQSEQVQDQFNLWCIKNDWVNDYSLFAVLKDEFKNTPWWSWPKEFKEKNNTFLDIWTKTNFSRIQEKKLVQWHLDRQWQKIKRFAEINSIKLIGDLPFYVSKDSVDVWSNKSLFSISDKGDLTFQSGVPPDYFSSDGQLWGTPVYNWPIHEASNFDWWHKRFKRNFDLVDILRLDHFRAMASYWRVKGDAENAINGEWIKSPGALLMSSLKEILNVKTLPIIAEDLGVITDDVDDLRKRFGLPGMKILQFAFDGNSENPYLPENINGNNWVVYTGTHDNSTTFSWWENLEQSIKDDIEEKFSLSKNPSWKLIELGMKTNAKLFIAPIQDILGLNDNSRLNKPGTIENNWKWKIPESLDPSEIYFEKYFTLGVKYSRINFQD